MKSRFHRSAICLPAVIFCVVPVAWDVNAVVADTSGPVPPAETPAADAAADTCHGEGKDLVCGHFKAAVARLLAEERQAFVELDADTDVTHCFLDIALDTVAKTVAGTNTLTVTSLSDGLATFTLDLRDNMIVDGVTMGGSPVAFTRPGHTIEIALDRPYNAGESFQVAVAYHGSPQSQGYGSFDWRSHGTPAAIVASTLSEPWYAHTWWPCKDSLGDKFTADLWFTVPSGMVVASNGLLQGTDTLPDGRLRYRWHESYPIATYLVSLAATNYVTWTQYYDHAGGSMPVQFFAYPESETNVRSGTTDLITQIATFSRPDVFGEYPFLNEKYGLAQFPWGGGMEHQTITSQGVFYSWINAHELAHQWWGDWVTCGTWHDIWLNEGFATWAEAVYQEKKPGGTLAAYLSWMRSNRMPGDFSGTVYVYNANSLTTLFNSNTVYCKGAWVLHMLRRVIGDTAMFNTLAAYRAAYQGGSAVTADFKAIAESVSGRDLTWFFDEWVYGPGAPSYRWGWQQQQINGRNYVRLDIEQYQTAYPIFSMPIDITITTASGTTTTVIWHNAAAQWYVVPTDGTATNVQFDKDSWILHPAPMTVAYVNGPPKLITAAPAPGAVLPREPGATAVRLGFSEGISFSPADFSIVGARSGPQPISVEYDASAYTITLNVPDDIPPGDIYTVTVRDSVTSSAAGKMFDGEMDPRGTLPSGDGLPGGNAVYRFQVASPGDFDLDGDVDLADFAVLQACFSGPNRPILLPVPSLDGGQAGPAPAAAMQGGCIDADLDGDADVDLTDYSAFAACFNGPNRPPACTP